MMSLENGRAATRRYHQRCFDMHFSLELALFKFIFSRVPNINVMISGFGTQAFFTLALFSIVLMQDYCVL